MRVARPRTWMATSPSSRSTTEAAGDESAAYRRLEREEEGPSELHDYSAAWDRLQPLAAVNGTLRERLEAFAASKRISLAALEALGTRVDVRGKGPEIRLAWAYPALRGGRVIVPALKFRDVTTGAREARKPSVFLEPLVIGERRSLDWFIAEGETDAARLYELVGDAAAYSSFRPAHSRSSAPGPPGCLAAPPCTSRTTQTRPVTRAPRRLRPS